MTFLGPLILRALLTHLADPNRQLWQGILLATSLLATAATQTLAINAYFHILFRVGMCVSSARLPFVCLPESPLSVEDRVNLLPPPPPFFVACMHFLAKGRRVSGHVGERAVCMPVLPAAAYCPLFST